MNNSLVPLNRLGAVAKVVGKQVQDNAPTLLSIFSIAGVVATAVLAVRDTPKAQARIEKRRDELSRSVSLPDDVPLKLTKLEIVKAAWPAYIPTATVALATCVGIGSANTISVKRQAALVGAYSLTEAAFREYKEKIVDTFGEKPEQRVRDSIAQDRMERDDITNKEVIVLGNGDVLCYDLLSGRYFHSDMQSIRKAQNDLNNQMIYDNYVSLNEFYALIGLPANAIGNELGWRAEQMMDLKFSSTLTADGRPCLAVDFETVPVRDFWRAFP